MKLIAPALRLGLTAFQSLRRSIWYFTRPDVRGVQAIALTAGGKIVLVKHRYANGWHLPGGGQKASERPREAVLRELTEEIGLVDHGGIGHAGTFRYEPDFRTATVELFVVRDVRYRPPWSIEIEEVKAFGLDDLPPDLAAASASRLSEHIATLP